MAKFDEEKTSFIMDMGFIITKWLYFFQAHKKIQR